MTLSLALILIATIGLAYANGANDNFKGVATLFGSGTANYRLALLWATVTTLLGSVTAVFLAAALLKNFSGRGLVDDQLVHNSTFVAAVALGAAATIWLATRIGMPVSTTHGLVGALVGTGWSAGSTINLHKLATDFLGPLLFSPALALAVTAMAYLVFHWARARCGITATTCFCASTRVLEVCPALGTAAISQRIEHWQLTVADVVTCRTSYSGRLLGLEAGAILDRLHFLSAGIVSFARGLNDTPKIASLLMLMSVLGPLGRVAMVGAVMALGGLVSARRVAEVMSQRITAMNHGQGLTANLVTGLIVIGASRLGLPVSTTQVSCGALFGIAAVGRNADARMIGKILAAWVSTMPVGAGLGAVAYRILQVF